MCPNAVADSLVNREHGNWKETNLGLLNSPCAFGFLWLNFQNKVTFNNYSHHKTKNC